jgi:hypothetical protein
MPLKRAIAIVISGAFYQTAVSNGFLGTEQDLLTVLKGSSKVTVSITPPENPNIDDIWVQPQT